MAAVESSGGEAGLQANKEQKLTCNGFSPSQDGLPPVSSAQQLKNKMQQPGGPGPGEPPANGASSPASGPGDGSNGYNNMGGQYPGGQGYPGPYPGFGGPGYPPKGYPGGPPPPGGAYSGGPPQQGPGGGQTPTLNSLLQDRSQQRFPGGYEGGPGGPGGPPGSGGPPGAHPGAYPGWGAYQGHPNYRGQTTEPDRYGVGAHMGGDPDFDQGGLGDHGGAMETLEQVPCPPRGTGRKRGRPKGSGRGRASKGSSPSVSPKPVTRLAVVLSVCCCS